MAKNSIMIDRPAYCLRVVFINFLLSSKAEASKRLDQSSFLENVRTWLVHSFTAYVLLLNCRLTKRTLSFSVCHERSYAAVVINQERKCNVRWKKSRWLTQRFESADHKLFHDGSNFHNLADMEVIEENEINIFREIVNDDELAQIPCELLKKIQSHFNAKCDEFITAKAVFESSRKNLGKVDGR